MAFCLGKEHTNMAIDNQCRYVVYDSGSNVAIVSFGLAKVLGL